MTFFLFWDTFYDKDRLMTYSEILYETKKKLLVWYSINVVFY